MPSPLRLLFTVLLLVAVAAQPAVAAGGSGGALAGGQAAPVATPGAKVTPSTSGGLSADASSTATPAPAAAAPLAADDAAIAAPGRGRVMAADVPYGPLVALTARRRGLSASLFTALVWQESGFRVKARSIAGARGLTQLMPGTAKDLGVRRIYDPAENLDAGARYLKAMVVRFNSTTLGLAAYNAGPGAVIKHRGVPPFAETQRYVRSILAIEARLRAAGVR